LPFTSEGLGGQGKKGSMYELSQKQMRESQRAGINIAMPRNQQRSKWYTQSSIVLSHKHQQ
jgi:hypothetical protein